jgi:hypothetical protein
VGTKIVWGGKFEEICVKSWHLGLNVVEKVGLLHVAALNFDGNFFE